MSYDISFKVKAEGVDEWVDLGETDANITWNVRDIIIKSTGLNDWCAEIDLGLCSEVFVKIERGYTELLSHPERYRKYESPNGWGTIEGTKHFFEWLMTDWNRLKRFNPKLASVAHFFIY